MGTAEFALIISGIALTVGIGNFIWNVWSKFIQPKPRLRMFFAVMTVAGDNVGGLEKQAIQISATNLGPNDVVINGVIGMSRRLRRFRFRTQNFIMFASSVWPHTGNARAGDLGNLPKRIAVGDSAAWFLPMDNRYFLDSDMTGFGLTDTFGRNHWVKGQDVSSVRAKVLEFLDENEKA